MRLKNLRSDIEEAIFSAEDELSDGYKFYGDGANVTNLVTEIMEAVRVHTNEQKEKEQERGSSSQGEHN